jgi:CRISPR-associated protein Csd1
MMLEALVALAERKGLVDDPSFAKRSVHYQLRIDGEGRPVALIPLGEGGRGLEIAVPSPPKRSVGITPAFLVDNAQYVLGTPKRKKGKAAEESAVLRAPQCLLAYTESIESAAGATGDEGLRAVASFLARRSADASGAADVESMAMDHEWTGDENLAFVLESDGGTYVHERPMVRAYWSAQRAAATGEGALQRCLVTGALAAPVRLHDSIKRIPEAQSSGASLVSFNQSSFTSHDFVQGANAPVSQRAADGYVRALNHLLEGSGERRFRGGVSLGPDTVMVFWSRDEDPTADVLLDLLDPQKADEEDMRTTLEAAWNGLAPREWDANQRFYVLTLSGNASRVVVRDWLETTAARVKANVRRYFADLALGGEPEPMPIGRLLRSLEATPSATSDKRGISAVLSTRLMRAALHGTAFPREILHAALTRLRLPPHEREWRGSLRARVGLIKATLIRLHPDRPQEVTVSLDPANHSVPYLLGRLFAAIERLQGAALGDDLNATIRDRYFGSASSTPSLVFPRLLRVSVHHATKAERDGRGWPERVKAEIMNHLPATGAFPATLDLEAQGLFAVGYYHQRQAFFTKRESPEAEAVDAAT